MRSFRCSCCDKMTKENGTFVNWNKRSDRVQVAICKRCKIKMAELKAECAFKLFKILKTESLGVGA